MTRSSWLIGLLLILFPISAAWADCFSYDNGQPRRGNDPDPAVECGGPGITSALTLQRGGSGSLTTLFTSNNGFAGNTFDLVPTQGLTIEGFAVNLNSAGATASISVYYRAGTANGFQDDPAGWTLLGTVAVVSNGQDTPTPVPLGGLELSAGTTTGFYVEVANYPAATMRYTNGGPNTYTNADLSLTTYHGKGNPAFTGSSFFPRQWNGTVFYSLGADLSMSLTDSPDPAFAGSLIFYQATSTNNGPTAATDVAISVPLHPDTYFVQATPSPGGVCSVPGLAMTGTVSCTWAGSTPAGTSRGIDIGVGLLSSTAANSLVTVAATTTSSTNDPTPGNNSANTSTTILTRADLSISLTDTPDPVTAGTYLSYTVIADNNTGLADAQDLTISLPLPPGTSLVTATAGAGGVCTGTTTVTCTWSGATAFGATRTATIVVAVASATTGALTASATVSSTTTDPNLANNTATASTQVTAEANLQLTLSASSLAVLTNEPVTFTAVSLNLGPSDAQNLSITLTLTPDFRYTAHTATGATCTTPQVGTTGAITCTWTGATAVNASRTLQVVAYSNNAGAAAVNASTVSNTSDPVTTNNIGNVSVQVGFAVEGIPTLNPYGLILLGLMLGLLGFVAMRRQA